MCPDPEVLAAYADRRLPPAGRDDLEAHLAACDACRAEAVALWRLAKPRVRRLRPARASWAWVAVASLVAAALLAVGLRRPPEQPCIEAPVVAERPPEAARHHPEVPLPPREPIVVPSPPAPAPSKPPPPPAEPAPPVVEPPTPELPKPAPPVTLAAMAVLDRVEGRVFVNGTPAQAGRPILPDDRIRSDGAAFLSFPDRTRLELEADTLLRAVSASRLILEKGAVKAEVAKQPQPLVFETPHGSARVLGTVLRIQVDTLLRLEVEEGRVELRNTAGRSITVGAGKSATSSAMSLKALPKEESVFSAPKHEGTPLIIGLDLLQVRGDEILLFDYWVDPQAAQVNFHFWNSTRKMKHGTVVTETAFGKWTRASFKLADLGLQLGDQLGNLFIQGTGGGSRQFIVDHLQLVRPYSLKPRSP